MQKFFLLVLFASCALSSCSSNIEEIPETANIEAELLSFGYEQDLEKNTFIVECKVKFTNKSSFKVSGVGKFTFKSANPVDDFKYSWYGTECSNIAAGESCTLTYYKSGDLGNPDAYGPEGPYEVEFVSAEYILLEGL